MAQGSLSEEDQDSPKDYRGQPKSLLGVGKVNHLYLVFGWLATVNCPSQAAELPVPRILLAKLYDRGVLSHGVGLGDLVLRKAAISDPTKPRGKLAPNWEGGRTTSYSPPSLCTRVVRSYWRSFAAEIHQVQGAVGHGHSRLQPRPPYKGTADYGQAPCKGQPAVAKAPLQGGGRLQGQQPSWGGQPCRQQGRRRRLQGWPPLGRAVAGPKGQSPPAQGQRLWRKGGIRG
ncbi:hypothetical protein BHE74_00058944 [Ensete ventricosum]|nr:hypothetical protein BHE74_00058944 [Ensete ventricosum]